jgi:ketosteroid isomerase-like protein
MEPLPLDIESWLKAFSRAVRDRNFADGKNLFDGGVVSFGTVCFRVEGVDALAAQQWRAVWPNTEDFDFDYPSAHASVETRQAVVAADWSSTGCARGGVRFQRRGRSTLVLRRETSGWKAVHTHFSLAPVHLNGDRGWTSQA